MVAIHPFIVFFSPSFYCCRPNEYYTGLIRGSHRWVDGTDCTNDPCQTVVQAPLFCGNFVTERVAMISIRCTLELRVICQAPGTSHTTADSRQQTTDTRQQTTDSRQQTTDNRQQTTDTNQQITDNSQLKTDKRH